MNEEAKQVVSSKKSRELPKKWIGFHIWYMFLKRALLELNCSKWLHFAVESKIIEKQHFQQAYGIRHKNTWNYELHFSFEVLATNKSETRIKVDQVNMIYIPPKLSNSFLSQIWNFLKGTLGRIITINSKAWLKYTCFFYY